MNPERWQQIKTLFHQATELAPAERAPFLAEACHNDSALRAEVEALLRSDDDRASWVSRGILEAAPRLLSVDPADSRDGQRLGAYRIVREISRGGMGAVYLAERDDDQYQGCVAIKVVKYGMDTDTGLARFRRERQILAQLRHPNVARLLDGGVTAEGLPFLVMEYIEGRPLDEYCDLHELSIPERLNLFLDVCAAVASAHRNLVVHRDLKPANILVTPEGDAKLLDFGIAKLLEGGETAETATAPGLGWMTPEYASPEQVRGEPITTAGDVYSLGVVLFELLSGERPYRFESRRPLEIERVVCEQRPEKPSTALRHRSDRMHRRLRGDLDNIVLKALAKEPPRRYSSVEQLAEDLRRHLDGRPVLARPNTWRYRTGKFVRRNWAAVSAAALIAVSVLVGIVATSWQAHRATIAQRRAERVLTFVEGLFEASDPYEAAGREIAVSELLQQGLLDIQQGLQEEPAVKARLMRTMGMAYLYLGMYGEAEELLRPAAEIRSRELGAASAESAESLTDLGLLRFYQDDLRQAELLLRRGLQSRRHLFGESHPVVAESLNHLGMVLEAKQDLVGAEELHRQALAIRRDLLGDEHLDVTHSLHNLAVVLQERGDFEEAEALFEQALGLRRRKLPTEHPRIATTMSSYAVMLGQRGDHVRSEELFRNALDIRLRVLGEDHPQVASSLNNLGSAIQSQKRYAEAEALFRRAFELGRRVLGEEHPRVTPFLNNLVAALAQQHRFAEAEPLLRKLLARTRTTQGEHHPQTLRLAQTLAQVLRLLGRPEEARELESRFLGDNEGG